MGRVAAVLAMTAMAASCADAMLARFELDHPAMGAMFRVVLYAETEAAATEAAHAAFGRIDALDAALSDYREDSELLRVCRDAVGCSVPVSEDLWRVLVRARQVSELSGGAFDVSVGPVVRLWRQARMFKEMPDPQRLDDARCLVGYRLVDLDTERRRVRLLQRGVRLDLGGIAKGYAVDEALRLLSDSGLARALVDAGGNVAVGEPPPGEPYWSVAVAPLRSEDAPRYRVRLRRAAVATSGDAWQFAILGGQRYSHIVDPRNGMALTGRRSTTVVAPSGMTADAWATALNVLGVDEGFAALEGEPGAAALTFREEPGGDRSYASRRWCRLVRSGTIGETRKES